MHDRIGFRPVLDEEGTTVGYLRSIPTPDACAATRKPIESAGRSFWGAYYREPASAKRANAS